MFSVFIQSDEVDAQVGTVRIEASVLECNLDVTLRPESRSVSNYSTDLEIDIHDAGSSLVASLYPPVVSTDNSGFASIDVCVTYGHELPQSNYDFYVRGLSHLQKLFANETAFGAGFDSFVWTNAADELIAGETSNVFDNKINSLDISTQITTFRAASYNAKDDLNLDASVDTTDLDITKLNFFKVGD